MLITDLVVAKLFENNDPGETRFMNGDSDFYSDFKVLNILSLLRILPSTGVTSVEKYASFLPYVGGKPCR
jgi:hypothetical protein